MDPPAAPTAGGGATALPASDVVARFQLPMAHLLLDFGDEVLDAVKHHKGVDVEDIRTKLLGPLRAYARDHLEAAAAAEAENTNSTLPIRGANNE